MVLDLKGSSQSNSYFLSWWKVVIMFVSFLSLLNLLDVLMFFTHNALLQRKKWTNIVVENTHIKILFISHIWSCTNNYLLHVSILFKNVHCIFTGNATLLLNKYMLYLHQIYKSCTVSCHLMHIIYYIGKFAHFGSKVLNHSPSKIRISLLTKKTNYAYYRIAQV